MEDSDFGLLEVYNLIQQIQDRIGNSVEVRFSIHLGGLEVRASWWDIDHHARHIFSPVDLRQGLASHLDYFVERCRESYRRRNKN